MASVDPIDTNTKFAAENKADYPILSDPDKKVAEAYGVLSPRGMAMRHTIIIGPDGKVLHVDKNVRVDTHAKDVADKLKELGIPARKDRDG